MYLINTLGWRWARRELSDQPQKEHLEHRIERQKLATCEDDILTRGAGRGRAAVIHARKTRGNRGNIGVAPPRSKYVRVLPKVTINGWRWGTWWEMSKGTRETMTSAHLGGRGAGRRCSCSATAAPAWSAGVATMVMSATMWIFRARFFGTFW